ncbi:MAG: hypothetical protein OXU20_09330 [Myxococcales bacterium]|nr:hypothetical protein [Myxococcales bacterium]
MRADEWWNLAAVAWLVACGGQASAPTSGADDDMRASTGLSSDGGAHFNAHDDFQGCPEETPEFGPGLRAEGNHFGISVVAATPTEPERYINHWTVEVYALDASHLAEVEIVRGETFMPIHGHDGRVQPQMTALKELGRFEVDRLNFTMRGPWEVRFWLGSASLEDYVVFEVCVAR